jgi:DNA polymerase III delta prime subunit
MEKIKYNIEGIDMLIDTSYGDMRQAINNLQATYYGTKKVNVENVKLICDQPDPVVISEIIKLCMKGNLTKTIDKIDSLRIKGYSVIDIIVNLTTAIKFCDNSITEEQKIIFMKEISQTQIIISKGIDSVLQLYACVGRIIRELKKIL